MANPEFIAPDLRPRLRIGLLETEPIRVAGFRSVFEEKRHVEIVPIELEGLLTDRSLGLALFSIHGGHANAFETLSAIRAARPNLRIIVMGSDADDETIIKAIAAGAKGYLEETASPDQVEQAIDVVESGSVWAPRRVLSMFIDRVMQSSSRAVRRTGSQFTHREREVLQLLVAARSNREIAESLGIEERTVKAHVARLMRKVGVDNRIALSIYAVTHALVVPESQNGGPLTVKPPSRVP
jgi:DNA-binding NarL/FixJ family response regulator